MIIFCHRCCSWPEYFTLHTDLKIISPTDHVWGNNITMIHFTNIDIITITPGKLVQWHSKNQYIPDIKSNSVVPKHLLVNSHHFPNFLLKLRQYNQETSLSTQLTLSKAINIQLLDFGHNQFIE